MTVAVKKDLIGKLKFKGVWRSYQQRVLDELEYHLSDSKLNIVAAPGAGKTTLGIEVMTRLGENSLILAPTITIRNQWKQRIIECFLSEDTNPDLISSDIKNISAITVSTYQALHSIYKNPEEKDAFLKTLNKNKINTLVLDEAHHLRTEWYQTLNNLCEEIGFETVVSLTGTPPYDVSPLEWFNYHSLCGPVDAEISIPELVKNGDLCPHQDLIYFSNLSKEEENVVFDFEKNRDEFFKWLNKSSDFMYAIQASAFVNDLDKNIELIYKNTGFTISVISYLLSVDFLNIQARYLAEFLQLELHQIPGFDYNIAQTLFNGILGEFEQYFKNIPFLKDKLKELKLLNGKKVDFEGETDFKKLFARSKNKLDAIFDITKNEYKTRKNSLREVVLLDYIGKGDSIGLDIFSVFDKLMPQNINLGILTGTLIVIPEIAKDELYKILEEREIDSSKILTVKFCDNYLRVESYGEINIVSIITELFGKGKMNVLIGTAALLGEGWDSPCVNTLIIASVVGSFMMSNQMRGRALRIDKKNSDKTANIWHLVSITSYEAEKSPDFLTIQKRFSTFEGISYKDNMIKNGIERFGKILFKPDTNEKMFEYAKDIEGLKNRWNQVFKKSEITEKKMASQVYEIIETHTQLPENIEYHNFFEKIKGDYNQRQKIKFSQKEQLTIANCVLKTLCDMDKIQTPYEDIEIESYTDDSKNFCITLLNCSNIERNIFIKSYNEIFYLDDNTRYILKINKEGKTKNKENIEKDIIKYLPVPEYIGSHQKYVKIFVDNLKGKNVQKVNSKPVVEESCLDEANYEDKIKFNINGQNKSITLKEYTKMVRYYLEYLNYEKILRRKYSDIKINAYKKSTKQSCLTFFNCTDYERNLIINNLCELFSSNKYTKNSLKTKEKDGLTYFVIPTKGEVNYKYTSEIQDFLKNKIENKEKQEIEDKYHKPTKILLKSMIIAGIITAVGSLGLFLLILMLFSGFLFKWIILACLIIMFTVSLLFYFVILYPIDFIIENINYIKKGEYGYGIPEYLEKINNNLIVANLFVFIGFLPYLLIIFVNLVIVLPMKFIVYKVKNKDKFVNILVYVIEFFIVGSVLYGKFAEIYGENDILFKFLGIPGLAICIFFAVWVVGSFLLDWLKDIYKNIKENPLNGILYSFIYFLIFLFIVSIISQFIKIDSSIELWLLSPLWVIALISIFSLLFSRKNIEYKKNTSLISGIKNNIKKFIAKYKYSLKKDIKIDMIYTKSDKNRQEVLKAKYNTYLHANVKRSRVWI